MRNVLSLPSAISMAVAFAAASGFALANDVPAKSGTAPPAVKSAATATTLSKGSAVTRSSDSGNAVRDWAKIDTNKDHSISPEEMEAYLQANPWPPKAK